MPQTIQKTLTFPLAGVRRLGGYRRQERPYAAPWAMNVIGVDPLEDRDRGGSRDGLAKVHATDFGTTITGLHPVTSIDSSGNRHEDLVVIADGIIYYLRASTVSTLAGELLQETGDAILLENGNELIFETTVSATNPGGDTDAFNMAERGGKLYMADSVLKVYDPNSGIVEVVPGTTDAPIPTACPLVAVYRDRIFLGGIDHQWYCSRQSDPTDWDFVYKKDDLGRAVAGQCSEAGRIGEQIKTFIPHRDAYLAFASRNSLWLLRGDPISGSLDLVSEEIGFLSPTAWAKDPEGTIAFLSNDGVYLWRAGSGEHPVRFSDERVPELLKNVAYSTNTISMVYDARYKAFQLFITPVTGVGTHWWLDVENKAMWPFQLPANYQPLAASRRDNPTDGLSYVVFGCKDGYLRRFNSAQTTDDGTAIASHVLIGPIRIASDDMADAFLAELHGIMAAGSASVTWRVVMGDTAESAVDAAVADITLVLAGNPAVSVDSTGTWAAGRNYVVRPRSRGAWMVLWLASTGAWAYEAVAIKAQQLGRLR